MGAESDFSFLTREISRKLTTQWSALEAEEMTDDICCFYFYYSFQSGFQLSFVKPKPK